MRPGTVKWFEAAGSGTAPVATVRGPSTAPTSLPNGPAGSSTGATAKAPRLSVTRQQVEDAWLASLETDGDSLLRTLELLGVEVTP